MQSVTCDVTWALRAQKKEDGFMQACCACFFLPVVWVWEPLKVPYSSPKTPSSIPYDCKEPTLFKDLYNESFIRNPKEGGS